MKFDSYPIASAIKRNLADAGFRRPTDIQYKAIPSILNGEDVLAVAQTGTGKTAAFAIPIIDRIHRSTSHRGKRMIQCIVMVPTRELAGQIGTVFTTLSRRTRVVPFSVYGGVEQNAQIRKLEGGIDILVATPGRMFDLISQGAIRVSQVNTLVLDEADRMLDDNFIRDIQSIKKKLPRRHQTLFFSATIDHRIKSLAYSQVRSSAIRIQLSPDDPVSKNVTHYVMPVAMAEKRFVLRRLIRDHDRGRFLVFVRTRVRVDRVAAALARSDIPCLTIHGGRDQTERDRIMARFKRGEARVLIATDLSARGIDIPDLDYVVNYDLPENPEVYVHRVGRTGRGTRKGEAVSFCSPEEKGKLTQIQTLLKKTIQPVMLDRDDPDPLAHAPDSVDAIRRMILVHENSPAGSATKKSGKNKRGR